jgi:carbamoylphosphate synthase large subunit
MIVERSWKRWQLKILAETLEVVATTESSSLPTSVEESTDRYGLPTFIRRGCQAGSTSTTVHMISHRVRESNTVVHNLHL